MTAKTDAAAKDLPDFQVLEASPEAVHEAARIIRAGGLVAFPTETVYGLGADATNDLAVASIFDVKGRPQFNPLIIHVRDEVQAAEIAIFDERAQKLAHHFWPGALTLVLKRRPDAKLSLVATAGLDTVAVRVPAHPFAHALLLEAGVPIAAPSANKSGYISPTQALHVLMQFKDRQGLNLIIDGGACPVGVESTILDLTSTSPTLLRPGGVALEELEAVLCPIQVIEKQGEGGDISAPGQLQSHYAPSIPIRINVKPEERERGESLLTFGPDMPKRAALNLSKSGDLREAAANLFTMMRALDMPGIRGIAVVPIPNVGLGRAINDRLNRAAAPKPGETKGGPPKAFDPIGKIEI
ncbi:MAG: L-threonylcarbamoyladenylate synthase [Rhodospirillales bacterium]|nr:L-threonylcarbamoyladenylate synthase [Rhodospirillales bacterium]